MSDRKFTPREAAIAVLAKAKELYQMSELSKAESKHDRCVKDVERNSPDVKNAHAVCVAEGVKPAKWSKSESLNKDAPMPSPTPSASPTGIGSNIAPNAATAGIAGVFKGENSGEMKKGYEGFKAVEASAAKNGASDPAAVAAAAGREKYGKEAFQHAAAAGKKMGKSDENPDEKQDAQLGEQVEDAVHQHEETSEHPGQHADEAGMKGHIKLAKFMGRMQHKKEQRAKAMDKGEHQPHPGPTSAVPSVEAASQAKQEAHLKTPQGEAERQERNAKTMQSQKKA